MSKTFAVVIEGKVDNIIVAESKEIAESVTGQECVEYTPDNLAHIGLGYDGQTFEQPPVPTVIIENAPVE